MFAGFSYVNVAFIFDLLKVRAQNNKRKQIKYGEEIMNIYRSEGLRGFMKGYQGMILRDIPGFAAYFATYEWMKRCLGVSDADRGSAAYNKKSVAERNIPLFLAGGMAGQICWIVVYPFDFLKVKL